ncbi:predicted protein [Naegleria gruberi]|uniref:Predicted protein n=1 Tax=Naegleria gruberi TaxID=5762 RepID=D2VQY4_NAEGR|nr:uncharacterized protein NAEGRDRAFT_51550 [Naegleria gruberi]EFC40794.1 predicted protein [Naegleria gruberi]|eukprot:XP_002673538.1 predicted protein [Naegleria gruberi strain NEG-M]
MESDLTSPNNTDTFGLDDILSAQADDDDNDFKPSITIKHIETAPNSHDDKKKKRIREQKGQNFITFCNILVILFSFAILIAIICLITIPNQFAQEIPSVDLMGKRTDLYAVYVVLRDLIRLAIENRGGYSIQTGYYYYLPYRNYLNSSIAEMAKLFPVGYTHPFLERKLETFPIFEKHWDHMIEKTCSFITVNGTLYVYLNETLQQEARDELYSPGYATDFNEFQALLFDFLDSASLISTRADYLRKDSLIVSISLICLSVVVLIPTIILLFVFAIRNEKRNKIHFHNANNSLMKDTMSDDFSRMKFKFSCQNSNLLNEFLLLEKIQFYKDYSNESLNMQMKLFEIAHQLFDKQEVGPNETSITKAYNEIEKAISYLERLKYETVIEIMDTYEISSVDSGIIDNYNNREDVFEEIDLLPPTLFQQLANDLTETLAETHIHYLESRGNGKMIDLEDVHIQNQTSI